MDFVQEDGETLDSAQKRDGNTHVDPVTAWGQLSQGHCAGPSKHWVK